jgi:hypothetical protein
MPSSLPPISSYHFTFESLEEAPQRATVVRDSTDSSLELELTVGAWSLTVTALAETGSGVKEIARGSASLLVLENITNSITVQLANEPGDEPGFLRYTVEFPDSVTAALLSLTSMDGGEDPAPVDLLVGSTLSGVVRTKTGVLDAAAGNYLLTIDLYGAAGNAGKTEVVHIYSNTETEAPVDKYTFSSGVFSSTTAYQTTGSQSLYDVLTTIGTTSGTDFTIVLNQDEPAFAPFPLTTDSFGGKKLRIRGGGHTVTLDGAGSLFTLETGAVLVLQDLELHGQGLEIDNNGALISVTGGSLLINPGTVITGNFSSSYGSSGGSVSGGTFTMSGGTITGNSSSYGGGVFMGDGTFTMSGGTITGNSSPFYGGGIHMGSGTFTMSGGTISGNSASSSYPGGGVSMFSGIFTMSGGTITGNSAASSSGGGVYVNGGAFTMNEGTITGNSSSSGGGVSVLHTGAFTMSGGTISGNSSSSGGGVSVQYNVVFTMSGGTITGNSSSSGGGVSVQYSGAFTMSGGTISGNSSYGGGGISVDGSSIFTMNGGTITGNSSSYIGSGVAVGGSGTFAMGNDARIEPSNEVYLDSGGSNSITLAGNFSGSDTIAVIDLGGGAADWLGKFVLLRDSEYVGTIPVDRFTLGNFVSYDYTGITKTPITNYVINSEGRLVTK